MSLLRSACRDTLRTLGHGEGRGKGERCERAVHRGSVQAQWRRFRIQRGRRSPGRAVTASPIAFASLPESVIAARHNCAVAYAAPTIVNLSFPHNHYIHTLIRHVSRRTTQRIRRDCW